MGVIAKTARVLLEERENLFGLKPIYAVPEPDEDEDEPATPQPVTVEADPIDDL